MPLPDERELTVRVQELKHGAGACVVTRQWPLRTLIAQLFDGRECDDVRALLAAGEGSARGNRLSWPPVTLTAGELTAIEQTFPPALPDRAITPAQVTSAELVVPAGAPRTAVGVRVSHPAIQEAMLHATYLRFDYGPWADLYEASLTRDQAMALLADAAMSVTEADHVQRAAMLAEEHDAALRFVVPREGEHLP
ncbi:MAG: hypothetical protein ABJD07_11440 [Gemmatimonadaceae bacterium]